jgi:TonB family protein
MRPQSSAFVSVLSVFAILTTAASAQADHCHFPKPARSIALSALPPPILEKLQTDVPGWARQILFAGRRNGLYFFWIETGNAIKIVQVTIFHLKQTNEVEVLEGGWPIFGDPHQMCKTTKTLLDKAVRQAAGLPEPPSDIASTPPTIPYPPISLRLHEQGTTTLTVGMDPAGSPTEVALNQSSGVERLDNAAIAYVKDHYRRQKSDGQTSATKMTVIVVWRIDPADAILTMREADFPPGAVQRREAGETAIQISLGNGRALKHLKVIHSSGHTDLDGKAVEIIRAKLAAMTSIKAGTQAVLIRWALPSPVVNDTEVFEIHAPTVHVME